MSEASEMNGLSIVIPAYNEEKAIVETIEHVTGVMEPSQTPYEVILVNDGSTDKTAVIIQSYLHDHPQLAERVRLVEHAHNRGYGASLKTGIRAAKMKQSVLPMPTEPIQITAFPNCSECSVNGD